MFINSNNIFTLPNNDQGLFEGLITETEAFEASFKVPEGMLFLGGGINYLFGNKTRKSEIRKQIDKEQVSL